MYLKNQFLFFKESNFVKKVLQGTFFLVLGNVVSKLLMALAYLILARLFSPEEYGEFGMIKSTVNNFLIFATMGLGLTTTKYISEFKNTDKTKASGILGSSMFAILVLGTLVASIVVFFAEFIANDILHAPHLQSLLKISGFILVFSALYSVQVGALLGLQNYKTSTIANILQGLLVTIGLVVGGYFYGVEGAVIGNLVAVFVLALMIYFLLSKQARKIQIRPTISNFKKDIKEIYKFALPASLATLITSPTYWLLNALLIRSENGLEHLGLYSAVIIFSSSLQLLNGSLNNVLLPIFLSKEIEVTYKKEFFNYYGAWIVSIIIALPFIFFPELVSFILGEKYPKDEVIKVLSISIFSTLILANKQGVGRDLVMKNKMWLSVFSMGQWSITALGLYVLFKQYGAVGFAAAISIAYIINFIVVIPFFVKLKITESYIMYNKWIFILWVFIGLLVILNIYLNYFLRISISIILLICIYIFFKKLYNDNFKKYNQKLAESAK